MSTFDLAPGARVELELGGHGRHVAHASWRHGERVAVALPNRLPVVAAALAGLPAVVAYASPRGAHRVEATVVAAGRDGILELAALPRTRAAERREHVRAPAGVPATVAPADGTRPALHTFTLDLSTAGVLLAGAGPVHRGDAVAVTVHLPGAGGPVPAPQSRVVRRGATGHVAVVFGGLERGGRERIARYVSERRDRRAR